MVNWSFIALEHHRYVMKIGQKVDFFQSLKDGQKNKKEIKAAPNRGRTLTKAALKTFLEIEVAACIRRNTVLQSNFIPAGVLEFVVV